VWKAPGCEWQLTRQESKGRISPLKHFITISGLLSEAACSHAQEQLRVKKRVGASACVLERILSVQSREAEGIGVDTELLGAALEPSQLSASLLLSIWQRLTRLVGAAGEPRRIHGDRQSSATIPCHRRSVARTFRLRSGAQHGPGSEAC